MMEDAAYEHLLKRVQRLEDIEAIRRLKATYLKACDSQDPERAKQCFAEGEVLIDFGHLGVFRSRDQWEALYRGAGCHPHILDMHLGANAEIEFLDDTHAQASWALDYRNINTQARTVTFLSVQYDDEYTKFATQWKITKCRSQFKTALHCSYAAGELETLLVGRSMAEAATLAVR